MNDDDIPERAARIGRARAMRDGYLELAELAKARGDSWSHCNHVEAAARVASLLERAEKEVWPQ